MEPGSGSWPRNRGRFRCGVRCARPLLLAAVLLTLPACEMNEGDFAIEGIRHFANARANISGLKKADDMTYTFNRCNGVYNELKSEYPCRFYWAETDVWELDLHKHEDGGLDESMADDVDFFYIETHGHRQNGVMQLLYDTDKDKWIGESTDWKLGDNDLEWLVIYACDTINRDDFKSKGYSRYAPLFHGLHLILGAWGGLWDGITTDECGEDFADNLRDGDTLKAAWFDGVSDWWFDQEAAVLSAEKYGTYNGGNPNWSQTALDKDHYHKKGAVTADIPHDEIYYLALSWIDG